MTAYPRLVLAAEYHDMEQYGAAVGWDLDFRQLDRGKLDASVVAIAANLGAILKVDFNRTFHQVGASPDGHLTFGIPNLGVGEFGWCTCRTRGGSLLNFNLNGGFEGVSPAGFGGFTFTLNRDALQAHAESIGYKEDLDSLVVHNSYWRSLSTISLSQRLGMLSRHLNEPERWWLRGNAELLNEEIATTVVESLLRDSTWNAIEHSSNRRNLLKRSLIILDDVENLPITVGRLCRRVGTSHSSLKRVFIEEFGIPPKVYIRSRCLSAVRDQLAIAPPETLIADVANRWGFWHMGQFAADYRKQFGELPRSTLKRNR